MQKTIRPWWKKSKMTQTERERYTMYLDWKNQRCENDSTIQSNLQILCTTYQTTNSIFHRTRTKNFTICMETWNTPNGQSNLEEEKQSGITSLISDYNTKIQQSKTLWDSILAQNRTQINGAERNPDKPTLLQSKTKEARIYNGEKIAFSINGAGKTGQLHVKMILE